jgi:hypothetical protein
MNRTGYLGRQARNLGWLALIVLAISALMLALRASAEAGSLHSSTIPLVTCTDTWTNPAGGAWTVGANWSTGSPPTAAQNACITLDGTYTVQLVSAAVTVRSLTFGGTTGTQLLQIADDCLADGALTVTATSTIGATAQVELTDAATCAGNATLAGPVTNNGLLVTDPGVGGNRHLQGTLTNTPLGTVQINTTTSVDGTSPNLKNSGIVAIADATTLNVPTGSTFTNTAGSVTTSGSPTTGFVAVNGGTFIENAGTTTGSIAVVVDDGTLTYSGAGASSIALEGTSSVGGSVAAGQSLTIQSTCAENAVATGTTSFKSNAGTITLTNRDSCGNNVSLVITSTGLTNSGTLTVQPGVGGTRMIQGSLTNSSNVQLNASTTYNGAGSTLDNTGTVTLANDTTLSVLNGASFKSDTTGLLTSPGSAQLNETGGTFTQGAGTTSGTVTTTVDDATLTYSGTGASSIFLQGTSTLGGKLAAGQALTLESTCAENALVSGTSTFTSNAGTVTLTTADSCAGTVTLSWSGTLTNSGTLTVQPGSGGTRALQGNLTNKGNLFVNTTTADNASGTVFDNFGTITIADGTALNLTNGASFIADSTSLVTTSGAGLLYQNGGTFTQNGGSTSGIKPVVLDTLTLNYVSTGNSNAWLHGASNLSGTMTGKQLLTIESTCAEDAVATANGAFTNNGTISLANGDSCPGNVTLTSPTGIFTSTNSLVSQSGSGGTRMLLGNMTISGQLTVNTNTTFNSAGTTYTNQGFLNVADGATFTVSNGTTFINTTGGLIVPNNTGLVLVQGATFNQGAGSGNGTKPVVVDDGTLNYTSNGGIGIGLRGTSTLTGAVAAGQTLSFESTCAENASATAPQSFVMGGTLNFVNADSCPNSSTLTLTTGTLTNRGTVQTVAGAGGTRLLQGSLSNQGTVLVDVGSPLQIGRTFSQTSAGTLKSNLASATSYGVLNVTGGSATLAGAVAPVLIGGYLPTVGTNFPVLTASSVSGTFATETHGNVNTKGLYLLPTYSGTGVSLNTTQATLAENPKQGLPGASVTVSGTSWAPNDVLTVTFKDALGVITTYSSANADSTGTFSTNVTIPSNAAVGSGRITVTSTLTGATLFVSFKVT